MRRRGAGKKQERDGQAADAVPRGQGGDSCRSRGGSAQLSQRRVPAG
ncbi:hypothetical protein ATSB10_38230 [Dyella thiooxydans]|uniref:Uncharacterized protein n=1 Tax=Dyella thiooxydans TaxID=445710 RepID=A0A160N5K0_9GAMM|nr:hypothetical protein ATSB10_38230 [Dyella thiooxydans]